MVCILCFLNFHNPRENGCNTPEKLLEYVGFEHNQNEEDTYE